MPNKPVLTPLPLVMLMTLPLVHACGGVQPRQIAPQAIGNAVDSLAARIVAAGLTPALGIAIVVDGRTVLARAHGFADVSKGIPAGDGTLWYLASTSKSFTGFGAALLAHEGAISLDAPIWKTVPQAQWHSGADTSRLTLAHFLSHTHGLDGIGVGTGNAVVMASSFTGAFPESEWPALARFAQPLGNSDLVYSNFGYNVAGMAIDAVRREGWRLYLDSAVYRPAGMHDTYARISGLDQRRIATTHRLSAAGTYETVPFAKTDLTMGPAGGHLATLRDLARWVTVQMDSGMIDGERVFPAEAVALSHKLIARHTVSASKRFGYFDRDGWAAGWDIGSYEGERMVSRFGAYNATRSHVSFLPRRRIGVVAMANGRLGYGTTDILAAYAYDLEAGRSNARKVAEDRLQTLLASRTGTLRQIGAADSTRAGRQKPLPRPLSQYVGSFRNDQYGTIVFETREDRLYYRWGVLSAPAEVYNAAKDQLRIEYAGNGTVVSFAFPNPGAPAASLQLMGETFTRHDAREHDKK